MRNSSSRSSSTRCRRRERKKGILKRSTEIRGKGRASKEEFLFLVPTNQLSRRSFGRDLISSRTSSSMLLPASQTRSSYLPDEGKEKKAAAAASFLFPPSICVAGHSSKGVSISFSLFSFLSFFLYSFFSWVCYTEKK